MHKPEQTPLLLIPPENFLIMKTLNAFIFAITLMLVSCGSTKNTPQKETTTEATPAPPVTSVVSEEAAPVVSPANGEREPQTDPKETVYRLIISFISIGEGTDGEARKMMDNVLGIWAEHNQVTLKYDTFPWGREGEVDFCFRLSELNTELQDAFVSEMKEVMKGRNLIQITENQKCMHIR